MPLKLSLTVDRKVFRYILIALVWCQTILVGYIRAVFMRLPYIGEYPDILITFIYVMVIILALPYMKIKTRDILIVGTILIVLFISPVLYPDTITYWTEEAKRFIIEVLPLFLVGVSMVSYHEDHEKVFELLYVLSVITIVLRILYYYTNGTAMTEVQSLYEGSMDGAYNLLPHICTVLYRALKKTNLLNSAVTIASTVFLLFQGTRGPVLIEFVCAILFILLFAAWRYKFIKVVALTLVVMILVFSPLFETILEWLYTCAESLGLSVRIIDKILSGETVASSGRDRIAEILYSTLNNAPFGYGLYSDRMYAGSYAHKLYLELWMNFGYVLGTIVLGALLFVPIKAFKRAKNQEIQVLIVVLYCVGIVKLFFSGSYLHERMLFLLLGVCVTVTGTSTNFRNVSRRI